MNVYRIGIGPSDASFGGGKGREVHVLASSAADAVEKGNEFLKHDYQSCPEELPDLAVVSVERLVGIDWPRDPQE